MTQTALDELRQLSPITAELTEQIVKLIKRIEVLEVYKELHHIRIEKLRQETEK